MFAAVGSSPRGFALLSVPLACKGDGNRSPVRPSWIVYGPRSRQFLSRTDVVKRIASSRGIEERESALEDLRHDSAFEDTMLQRRVAHWRMAKAYKDSSVVYEGRVENYNAGGLLIRFHSLVGFLPYPQLSPSHSCKDLQKSIHDVARELVGTYISVKVIEVNEKDANIIFSEKQFHWSEFGRRIKVGDVFHGMVSSVEDYGAFVHVLFPDGCYYLTGLVHISEVSWDLIHDIRDVLHVGQMVKVKVIYVNSETSRLALSLKQMEMDPLLETLDMVIPQDGLTESNSIGKTSNMNIEPLPGLESICGELLQEQGIKDVRLGRQVLEKRVVSQDLELWLSSVPANDQQFTLLARAGRQVQEVHLTTTLDHDGIRKAVQHALERIP
ncbi:hypothetical protein HPP92_003169 [Vanilla planifolia]|uniref:S1 motif domain-containing protein n=1 Tax=Vanilla planifolia TaxID=51239 RepID=A0A835RX63_VANPL|nr:hypothetical protein HPP92_003169 [Vanilla planifolia]